MIRELLQPTHSPDSKSPTTPIPKIFAGRVFRLALSIPAITPSTSQQISLITPNEHRSIRTIANRLIIATVAIVRSAVAGFQGALIGVMIRAMDWHL
jgi:hypothetical protein